MLLKKNGIVDILICWFNTDYVFRVSALLYFKNKLHVVDLTLAYRGSNMLHEDGSTNS